MIKQFAPLLLLLGSMAAAQAADSVVEAARASGAVGEQADGFLGMRAGGPADLKARVDQINIKRRAIYTETAAARPGVSVSDVAAAAGCEQFRRRVASGQWYRDAGGSWAQRQGGAPVPLPPYCG